MYHHVVKLNDLIDSWNLDPQAVYGANQYIIPLVANQGVYTIGSGGNLNIPRPTLIQQAFIRQTSLPVNNQTDIPLPILTNQQWANLPQKAQVSSFPFYAVLYYH